jgi:peroxiredoxin
MSTRPSPAAIAAIAILVGFTAWITRQAKALEKDLNATSQKIALLDRPAPDFHRTTLDGHPVSLADYRGKKLVLIFWASWNNASHPSMMTLSSLYQNGHKPDSDFEMLGVSLDEDRAAAEKFISEGRTPFPTVLDDKRSLANTYQVRSLPTALLIDADGKVVYGFPGVNQRGLGGEWAQRLGIPEGGRMERGPFGRGN